MTEQQVVHVVMGNDFPECVFSTEEAADRFCERMKNEPRSQPTQRECK